MIDLEPEILLVIGESHLAERLGELTLATGVEARFLPFLPPSPGIAASWGSRVLPIHSPETSMLPPTEERPLLKTVLLLDKDDEVNLHAALKLRDECSDLRIVLSFFNYRLGRKIERELGNCRVLSTAEISAPRFVTEALLPEVVGTVTSGDNTWCFIEEPRETPSSAFSSDIYSTEAEAPANIRFVSAKTLAAHRPKKAAYKVISNPVTRFHLPDRYLIGIVVVMIGAFFGATAFFHFSRSLPWMSSFYLAVSAFTFADAGDFVQKNAKRTEQLVEVLLMLVSVTLTACLFAIITDALIKKRTDIREGRRRYRMKDHYIICGLGRVGLLAVQAARALRLKVLVIERDRENPLLDELEFLKVPYMIADATRAGVLSDAGIGNAAALLSMINRDMTNLEIGLAARSLLSDIHLVLRMFSGETADRIRRHFHIHTALSTSATAAPAFLAAALDDRAVTFVEISETWYVVLRQKTRSETVDMGRRLSDELVLVEFDKWFGSENRKTV